MKQKKKILSAYKRKLHIEGKEWTYRITSQTIEVCNPERTQKYKIFVDASIDMSCDCDDPCDCFWDYEGPYYKGITPTMVKEIIEKKLIKKLEEWRYIGDTKENALGI